MQNPDTHQQNTAEQPTEASYRIPPEDKLTAPLRAAEHVAGHLKVAGRRATRLILHAASLADPNKGIGENDNTTGDQDVRG